MTNSIGMGSSSNFLNAAYSNKSLFNKALTESLIRNDPTEFYVNGRPACLITWSLVVKSLRHWEVRGKSLKSSQILNYATSAKYFEYLESKDLINTGLKSIDVLVMKAILSSRSEPVVKRLREKFAVSNGKIIRREEVKLQKSPKRPRKVVQLNNAMHTYQFLGVKSGGQPNIILPVTLKVFKKNKDTDFRNKGIAALTRPTHHDSSSLFQLPFEKPKVSKAGAKSRSGSHSNIILPVTLKVSRKNKCTDFRNKGIATFITPAHFDFSSIFQLPYEKPKVSKAEAKSKSGSHSNIVLPVVLKVSNKRKRVSVNCANT